MKKYYLQDVLQFLLPYIKSRAQSGNLPSPSNENDPVDETTNVSDVCTQENDDQYSESQNETDAETQTTTSEYHTEAPDFVERSKFASQTARKKFRQTPAATSTSALQNEADKCFIDYVKRQSTEDADLEFLRSLLPDVKKMDPRRKRRFKTSILEMIDNILVEQEDEALRIPSTMNSWNRSSEICEQTPVPSRMTSGDCNHDYTDLDQANTPSTNLLPRGRNDQNSISVPGTSIAQYFSEYQLNDSTL